MLTSRGLTGRALSVILGLMRMTIEIPDQLAQQLEPERDRLAEIIARGLRRTWSKTSGLRREVISFLARRPAAEEILQFCPSEQAARARGNSLPEIRLAI